MTDDGQPSRILPLAGKQKTWRFRKRAARVLINVCRVRVGRERTGTPFPFFFIQRERRSRCFFLYTPIVYCNFLWKSFGYKADSLDICVYVYDIMDDTSAVWDNWPWQLAHKTAFRLCFTRLILTLKPAHRIHQNAPLPEKKSKFLCGGARPPSQTFPPLGRGYPLPRPHFPRRLDSRAYGARRSRSFLFTIRTRKRKAGRKKTKSWISKRTLLYTVRFEQTHTYIHGERSVGKCDLLLSKVKINNAVV